MERIVTTGQCVELINADATAGVRFSKATTTIKVAQIFHAARPVHDGYERGRRQLLEEFGTVDADGKLAAHPDGTLIFATPTGRKEFEARHSELLAAQTTVVVPRLDAAELAADGVTPAVIFPLLPFVDATIE